MGAEQIEHNVTAEFKELIGVEITAPTEQIASATKKKVEKVVLDDNLKALEKNTRFKAILDLLQMYLGLQTLQLRPEEQKTINDVIFYVDLIAIASMKAYTDGINSTVDGFSFPIPDFNLRKMGKSIKNFFRGSPAK